MPNEINKNKQVRNGGKTNKKKAENNQTDKLDLAVGEVLWWFQATSRGDGGNGVASAPAVPGGGGGRRRRRGEEEEEGRFFFLLLVLLFVTPLKMYMGITSKLVDRKTPFGHVFGVRYIVRYECTPHMKHH